jgi:regulator of PEP synthase PpsR (kinase-PPPase family)
MKRTVFFVSDRTGITAETLAHSLLTQFEDIKLEKINCPFIDSVKKVEELVDRINAIGRGNGARPLVFSTLIDASLREKLETCNALVMDLFHTFIRPMEKELGVESSHAIGKSHGVGSDLTYKARIDAINFALANDDGVSTANYPMADVILVGVSRTGKTPTSIYLALQFGILAANYPLNDEDLERERLPRDLLDSRPKLFGLTILPDRLSKIRSERRANSRYASLRQCEHEVRQAESLLRREGIPFINTSAMSIEEIATTVVDQHKLERRWYG